MNVSIVRAYGNKGTRDTQWQNGAMRDIGRKGQIIKGRISKVSDQIYIDFDGREVQLAKSAIRNAKEGEIREFEIMDISDKGIVLKEVGPGASEIVSKGIISTGVEMDKSGFAEMIQQAKESEEGQEDSDGKTDAERLSDTGNRITEEDYRTLEEEGMSIEKFDMERLERALSRIKEQRAYREESVEKQVRRQQSYKEQIEKASRAGYIKNSKDRRIAERLLEADIPITEENIRKISNAMEQSQTIEGLSDKAKKYLIDNQLSLTVENIYHARYAGSRTADIGYKAEIKNYKNSYIAYTSSQNVRDEKSKETDSAWREISSQAEKIVKDAGYSADSETMQQAKWLFENDLPITPETLKALKSIEKLTRQYDSEDTLDKIVNGYEGGTEPEKVDLDVELGSAKTVEEFLEKVNRLLNSPESSLEISDVTARRQLEEIRLKMTIEAGRRLVGKGIDLNINNLVKIVDGLREMEDSYYQNMLRESHTPVTKENISILKETTHKVNTLKESPMYVLGKTLRTRFYEKLDSLDALHEEARSMKVQMDKAGEAYETLKTMPRKDMGDSIEKAFSKVDNILKNMNLDITDANRRAVKILGYNSMEITHQNISDVKAYDTQVNAVLDGLHPAVTVEMIKRGINPMDMPVTELNFRINRLKEELGITEDEKYSKFLWKLDREDALTTVERKAFVGMYRLLQSVEKSDGAAVGSVINAGQEVTLNHLLTAVRTRKALGLDAMVDDDYGKQQGVTRKHESISQQIEYFTKNISNIKDNLDFAKWCEIMNGEGNFADKMADFMDQSVEKLSEDLKNAKGNVEQENTYAEEKIEEIRDLAQEAEDAINFLTEYKQPVTVENIVSARQMMEKGKSLFRDLYNKTEDYPGEEADEILETMKKMEEGPDSSQQAEILYERIEKNVNSILDKAYGNPTITSRDFSALKLLGSGIRLAKSLCREEHYEIPMVAGKSVTNINLTIVKGGNANGRVHIAMDSERLGRMEADIAIKDSELKGCVLCNNTEGLQAFKEQKENLKNAMEGLGLNVGQLDYGLDKNQNSYYSRTGSKGGNTNTRTLYQAAKAFIRTIRAAESGH